MSNLFGRSIHRHGLVNNELPLRRYFLLIGGILLALLFAIDALTPRQPTIEAGNSGPRLPRIRIYSEQRGPEAVVMDTSRPVIVATPPAEQETAKTITSPEPRVAEDVTSLAPPSPRQTDAKKPSQVEPKPQRRSNLAKARAPRPPVYAQRPDVGWFDGAWTFGPQDARIRDSFAQLSPRGRRQGGGRREVAWARTERARRSHFGWFDAGW